AMNEAHRDAHAASTAPVSRLQRRKMRTRMALIHAAQGFIAEGKLAVPVLEITQAADVGMGSFYNHFDSKDELFEAAATEALDGFGALVGSYTAAVADPAAALAARCRLCGRLFRIRPQGARLVRADGSSLVLSEQGLSP